MNSYGDLAGLVAVVQAVGPIGLLIFIYWRDQRQIQMVQAEADKRFGAMKEMYESNVVLVRNYEKIAGSLSDLISLNIQHLTRVEEKIENNQYCPVTRRKEVITRTVESEVGKI